jgi:type VI secretion system secreted protein Hcp
MPGDQWLKIPGIEGEATDDGHKKEIDLQGWSWGMTHPVEMRGGGLSGGETSVANLTVIKAIDKASPNIMKFCLAAKAMDEVLLTMRKRGENPIEFVKIKMKQAVVAGVNNNASSNGGGTSESVSFAFEAVEFEYTPQKPDGQPEGAVTLKWNIKANKEG